MSVGRSVCGGAASAAAVSVRFGYYLKNPILVLRPTTNFLLDISTACMMPIDACKNCEMQIEFIQVWQFYLIELYPIRCPSPDKQCLISFLMAQVSFDEIGFMKWSQSVRRSVNGATRQSILAKSNKMVCVGFI